MQKAELKKCQKITNSAIQGYVKLLRQKELFEQSIHFSKRIEQTVPPAILHSIAVIQDSLYAYLVVDIHSWIFDKTAGLSVYELLEKLKNEHFANSLKGHIANISKGISLDGQDHSKFLIPHIKLLEIEFDQNIQKCISSYDELLNSEFCKRFIKLRNKQFAHKDKNFSITKNGNKIGDVIEATEAMRDLVLLFNKLFQKCSYDIVINDDEKIAKKRAIEFWSTFLPKN